MLSVVVETCDRWKWLSIPASLAMLDDILDLGAVVAATSIR